LAVLKFLGDVVFEGQCELGHLPSGDVTKALRIECAAFILSRICSQRRHPQERECGGVGRIKFQVETMVDPPQSQRVLHIGCPRLRPQ